MGNLLQIRPIDKKCGYRMERLLSAASTDTVKVELTENVADATQKSEDLLKYRPNPDMLVSKTDMNDDVSIYCGRLVANITLRK